MKCIHIGLPKIRRAVKQPTHNVVRSHAKVGRGFTEEHIEDVHWWYICVWVPTTLALPDYSWSFSLTV